jgi:hypothetical protein
MLALALGLLIAVAVVGGIVALIVFLMRSKRTGEDPLTVRTLLRAYLHVASFAGLVTLLAGAALTLQSGFARAFGESFSFYPCCGPAGPDVPAPTDDQVSEALIKGLVLLMAGVLFGVSHRVALRVIQSAAKSKSGMAYAGSLLGTAAFGLVAIVTVPVAAYGVIRLHLLGGETTPYSSYDPPGQALAVAMVFGAAWGWYLAAFVRQALVHGPDDFGARMMAAQARG